LNQITITLYCFSATERYRRLGSTWCFHCTVEEAATRCHVPESRNLKVCHPEKLHNIFVYLFDRCNAK